MRQIRLLFLALPLCLWGQGENPTVVKGHATFEYPDSKTQVIRADDKTVINYTRFNLAAEETARFIQPNSKSSVLCRVTGNTPSTLAGRLEANGRLFFINPFGIFFSDTAKIQVGSLIATTMDIKDEDFAQGRYKFILDPSAHDKAIIHRGTITASGSVAFLGAKVINQGIITAKASRLSLAGEIITLDFDGDDKIAFAIEAPLVKGMIEENGKTICDGIVALSLGDAKAVIQNVVNSDGLQEAAVIQNDHGVIRLLPGNSIKAKQLEIDGMSVELSGSFTVPDKIEAHACQKIHWKEAELAAKPNQGVHFEAPEIILDSPLGDKHAVGKTVLIGKTISQNSSLKSLGPVFYRANLLRLGGEIRAPNQMVEIDAPVILTNHAKIVSGKSRGSVYFKSTVESEKPPFNLTLEPASEANTVEFQGKVRGLGELKIETGRLVLNDIGDQQSGACRVEIDASQVVCEGATYYALQQQWKAKTIQIKNTEPVLFRTESQPLVFDAASIHAIGNGSVTFEAKEGDLKISNLIGTHAPLVNLKAGFVEMGLMQTGLVYVQGHQVHLKANIQAEKVFIEADMHIADAAANPVTIYSQDDVILRSKQGSIGSEGLPIKVEAQGTFSLGAKVSAYVNSPTRPLIYQKECPALLVCNGVPLQLQTFASAYLDQFLGPSEEDQVKSLAPDLEHRTPESYTDGSALIPRRAPIYYKVPE